MRYRVLIARRAAAQIRSASAWWIEHRDKAPEALAEDVEQALDLVGALPATGQRVSHPRLAELRRLHLSRIHYYLYYSVDRPADTVEVLALWHVRRGMPPRL